ncbi:MAG: right-handed parallel beta-helix repeat-containing protein [Sedimentisphaerales bacterium]
MKPIAKIIAVSAFLALCSPSLADELLVPTQYPTIQSAIDAAIDGDTIIVAPGTYTGEGNRDIDFLGKAITVRSETGPENCIINCNGTEAEPHRGFYFHNNEDANSILEGFTIIGGYGGGILCRQSSPTISKCRIINNYAASGGGIACIDSNAIFSNCIIKGNHTDGCASDGGGIYCRGGSPIISCCDITGNWTRDRSGGGIYCRESSPTIINCRVVGNFGREDGGGIACVFNSNPVITGCTIASNKGGGISGSMKITNSILWGNEAQTGAEVYGSGADITYSDVQGSWPGQGNIDADPCFVEPGYWDVNGLWLDGDYHLKSAGWRWDSVRDRWDYDDVTSRCIDTGNPGSPLGEELLSVPDDPDNIWGQNLRIDMGAYGGTAEASMPPYDWALLADLNNDGLVNLEDYAFQIAGWLNSADQQPGDLNRDGLVDISDLALLVEDWLRQTTWHE